MRGGGANRRTKDLLKINPWPGILERRIDARLKADAIRDAEHRVAEAALKLKQRGFAKGWAINFGVATVDEQRELVTALDDLRRLKGEG